MLEFPSDFFKPEIRQGFFIDATMKTMWAAEIEVLQTVAEICERHGLAWYAGFGTLLGAIREEGFIPWDDDIDIMMLREDYQKLMMILPAELPEGFHFRSPFSAEGYSEFHSNILNSDGIDTSPAFLSRFHNCPFTVGIDIFPMDYLPRDPEKRAAQKRDFALARKAAQLAQTVLEGYRSEAEVEPQLRETIRVLDQHCNTKFQSAWIRQKQWDTIMLYALRLSNEIAGRYGADDSDEIVMYNDYNNSERAVFRKEWFSEIYSATFEAFMFPVPSGYDEILKTVYGDYMVRRRVSGQHEYPFYAHQLRQLRAILKERQQAIGQGYLQGKMDEKLQPSDWLERIPGKKVILYISGLPMYSEYEEKALDKLEENLKLFYENRDRILLWWRPQAQMKTLLSLISQELVKRYENILAEYKAAGWGICDESEDEERAVEYCNAYYGEMSENARMAQREKKPVMIEQVIS